MYSYSEDLRADLADHSISVVCVYPGPTDTRMAEGQVEVFPDDFAKQMYSTFLDQLQKLAQVFATMG